MAMLRKKLNSFMLSVTLRSLPITRVGAHENSLIGLSICNLPGWETLQKNQAENRTTQKRQFWLVTHCTRDYSYLKIPTRALLVLCDKKVITEWQEESTTWLKLAEILGINQCSSYTNTNLETQQEAVISPVMQLSSHCVWLKKSS